MIAGQKYDGLSVDIWSCGVILFALICGYLPFQDKNTSVLYKKILEGTFHIPRFVGDHARDLIKRILVTDPAKRIKVAEIRAHPWFLGEDRFMGEMPCAEQGLMVGYNHIPIDEDILRQIEEFGFNPELTQRNLDANKHTHETTTYYLLLRKKARREGIDMSKVLSAQLIQETPKKKKKKVLELSRDIEDDSKDSPHSETGGRMEVTRRSLGGSDPRNKRALDLNEAQLYPPLAGDSSEGEDEVEMDDELDLFNEEMGGGGGGGEMKKKDEKSGLMEEARLLLLKSKQVDQGVGRRGGEERSLEVTEQRVKQVRRVGRPVIKAVRVKNRGDRKYNTSFKNNDSMDSQRRKMDSSRTEGDKKATQLHPSIMAYSNSAGGDEEDSFIQFGMDAIRAHLEGNQGGINSIPTPPSHSFYKEEVGRKTEKTKKVTNYMSHSGLTRAEVSHLGARGSAQKYSSLGRLAFIGPRGTGGISTRMLQNEIRKPNWGHDLSGYGSLNTTLAQRTPEQLMLIAQQQGVNMTIIGDVASEKNKTKAAVAKKGALTLRQTVGNAHLEVGQKYNTLVGRKHSEPGIHQQSMQPTQMPLNYDLAVSKQQFRMSPPILPSSKFNAVRRPTHIGGNLNSSNISNPNIGEISGRGKTDRPANSYRNPVEPSVPKPQILPKYRMKMLVVHAGGKLRAGASQSKIVRAVINESRQSKQDSKKGGTGSRYSTNYRSTKSFNKQSGMVRGTNRYAPYASSTCRNTVRSSSQPLKERMNKSALSRGTDHSPGGTGGGITIIQTPLLNNINHYNSYNIGQVMITPQNELTPKGAE